MSVPEIFDRNARRHRTLRASKAKPDDAWLVARASEEISLRLSAIRRQFASVLLITPRVDMIVQAIDPEARIVSLRNVCHDEDRQPFADHSFDCIISIGLLDTVNDLPGALALFRRALTPDGVILAALAGAGSLPTLRALMAECDPGRAHFHPQIDVRAMGDLMLRAGFAQPVVDMDLVEARYSRLCDLVRDLRANGQGNVLIGRQAMRRQQLSILDRAFTHRADDGRVSESFVTLHATGWATAAR